jgi:AcrR family transcriptional regulator
LRNDSETNTGPTATRAAILDVAESLFGERGFRKTTLEDVAAAARVSRPLVYRYFGDKRALFELVVDRVLKEWNVVLVAEADRATPGTAHTLRIVLAACLEFARSRTVLRGLLVRDSRLVRSAIGGVIEADRNLLPKLIRDILEQGVRRGDVRADLAIEDMAHVVAEVFVSYSLLVLEGETAQVSDRRVEAIVETLLHGVIAPAVPARPEGGRVAGDSRERG